MVRLLWRKMRRRIKRIKPFADDLALSPFFAPSSPPVFSPICPLLWPTFHSANLFLHSLPPSIVAVGGVDNRYHHTREAVDTTTTKVSR